MTAPAATPTTQFNPQELDLLSKTADALTAYMGKAVLAEVAMGEDGTEWVSFGTPVEQDAEGEEDLPHVQLGGPQARLLGNRGGLEASDLDAYDCIYLWAIQITLTEGERFVKLDQNGEETAWSDDLNDMLPFAFSEEPLSDDDEDEDDDDTDDDKDDDFLNSDTVPPHGHSIH